MVHTVGVSNELQERAERYFPGGVNSPVRAFRAVGGHPPFLVKAGSGVATLGIPGSAGVPAETAMHTLALPFNDLGAVEAVFAARPEEIACVIVEPVVGNAGTIPPAVGYLEALRDLCTGYGA